ncbi:MAG: hypothetical protein UR66_C0008G0020 [Candidatus Moranbacteria bacterium GW2011_GWE1_35_17]|nr:MAG: hypothetical protein UR66_C0008G0020 [Candidatus Moranbacteria bacterium GW2011_GWE1_35_17]KKP71596.1 MAG: hypothetical protein UR65_C0030G0005 [Candidatus Moranbacteria bacterium GW2011_GWE2_35_164]KKP80784.1 MAG: hypothetical protein UR82_C0082G0005 [Candidatus Moranbacteria bacterium GW2011_GWF1_35_5]KKP84295.1 MAG: hypothetical protein UR83_C0024G0024 [Candidatus Moranbacteria bacterium GW2011_GWF2_35_54]
MKKYLIIIGVTIGILAVPFLGMTISPTRELIMGLAPDEAVLQLADRIDDNKIELQNEIANKNNKINELQSSIDQQEMKILEQQKLIDTQKSDVASTRAESQVTVATVMKQKDCSIDMNKYCVSDSFTDPDKFKKFLKVYEEDFSKSEYEKYKDKFTKEFNSCQEALKCK